MKEKLTILGSGTCVSGMGWERKERWPGAYLLEIEADLILLECPEGVRYQLQAVGQEFTQIGSILISHIHPDHFALPYFAQSVAIKKHWGRGRFPAEVLDVYGPVGIKDAFWRMWRVLVGEHPNTVYDLLRINFIELKNGEEIKFFQGKLKAFSVFHAFGRIEALTFRRETPRGIFAYSGDSGPCPGLEKAAQGADVFLCEASANIGEDKSATSGHLNPYQAGELAKKTGVKKLWLTHYSGKDSPAAIIKECQRAGFKGKILVVKDGDKLPLFGQ